MKQYSFYHFGFFAPGLFVFTAILGGALRPGYSHLTDTVSELFTVGSPNRLLLSSLYLLFALSLILFGIGLSRYIASSGEHQRIGIWGTYLFILVGVLNILTATVFPQDPWGAEPTFPGEMHKIVSGVITLLSVLYMLLLGIWFRRTGIARHFLAYSIITIIGAVVSGVWFAVSVGTPLMGFTERLAIAVGFQWTIVLSCILTRSDK